MRPPLVFTPGDKKTRFRLRNKLSHAPNAVSAEYRGKLTICKKYFCPSIVIAREVEESLTAHAE
jgi:hypothetical protein